MRKIQAVCCSHEGKVRKRNEDSFVFFRDIVRTQPRQKDARSGYAWSSFGCFGVFDGVGSLRGSERASGCAAETFAARMRKHILNAPCSGDYLRQCCLVLNAAVCNAAAEAGHAMGTTGVLLMLQKKRFAIANVGDSPVYLYRNCHLRMISQEHTDRELLSRLGVQKSPSLAQYIGIPKNKMEIDPYAAEGRSFLGDRFLLCSDGLSAAIPEKAIERICHDYRDTTACADRLMAAAMEAGGGDNITIIVCDVVK